MTQENILHMALIIQIIPQVDTMAPRMHRQRCAYIKHGRVCIKKMHVHTHTHREKTRRQTVRITYKIRMPLSKPGVVTYRQRPWVIYLIH